MSKQDSTSNPVDRAAKSYRTEEELGRELAETRLELEKLQVAGYKKQQERDGDQSARTQVMDFVLPRIESARRNVEILQKVSQLLHERGDKAPKDIEKAVNDMMLKNINLMDASAVDAKAVDAKAGNG